MTDVRTLRVTKVQESFKSDSVRFSAVPVHPETQTKTSAIDFYFVDTNILPTPPVEGQIWEVTGEWFPEKKPSYDGNYFINHHTLCRDHGFKHVEANCNQAFVDFVRGDKSFKGISEGKARALWAAFNSEIFNVLKNRDIKQLKTVLSPRSAQAMIDGFAKYGLLQYAVWMTDKGIPVAIQKRIFKFKWRADGDGHKYNEDRDCYSVNPIDQLKANPYVLTSLGLSFKATDSIAKKHFTISDDDSRRLAAAVTDALRMSSKGGHTIADPKQIKTRCAELLRYNDELIAKAMEVSDKHAYIIDPVYGTYQHRPVYIMEQVVAKRLLKLNNQSHPLAMADEVCQQVFDHFKHAPDKHELTPQLQDVVKTSVTSAVSCITGGAGTGKTTILNATIEAYVKLGFTIKPMALSGRAAMRLSESIGMNTSTIAKFVRETPIEDANCRYYKEKDEWGGLEAIVEVPASKHLVVIDEASMLDLPTMYRIVTHIDPSVRILFVGDPNQLPPIGAGNILADIVNSGVIPNSKLDIVQRQCASTGIPEYSESVIEGVIPPSLSTGNITFHETEYGYVADVCVALYKKAPKASRIVAATNKLVDVINDKCQQELNSHGEQLSYEEKAEGRIVYDRLYLNDPVLFTQNNYDFGVQNDSLGKLISVEHSGDYVGQVLMDDGGDVLDLSFTVLLSLKAGYAMTLHKAQGSQFPIVIIALTPGRNLDRSWLYTAITRAEHNVHIVGPREKVESAITKVSNVSYRKTALKRVLQDAKQVNITLPKRYGFNEKLN